MKKSNGIVFIILIPILFIIFAFVYDNVYILTNNKIYETKSKLIMEDVLTNSYNDKVMEVSMKYQQNKYETSQLDVTYENNELKVYNVHSYKSFFGNILGIKTYRSEVNLIGYYDNDGSLIIKQVSEE